MVSGHDVLFGFSIREFKVGGPAWTVSAAIQSLDRGRGHAVVDGGDCHHLGRHILASEIPQWGLEAWFSYGLLVAPHAADQSLVPLTSWDEGRQLQYIGTRRLSRRLGFEKPVGGPTATELFLPAIIEEMGLGAVSPFLQVPRAEEVRAACDDPSSSTQPTPVPR